MSSSSSSSPSLPPPPPLNDDTPQLTLKLNLATHPIHPTPSSHSLTIDQTATILDVKQRLFNQWDGNPKPDGITLIKGGKVCRDVEPLIELFQEELNAQPPIEPVLHVVIRPNSWSTPFNLTTSVPSIETTPPSPSPPAPTASSSNNGELPIDASTPTQEEEGETVVVAREEEGSPLLPSPSSDSTITSPPSPPSSSGYTPSYLSEIPTPLQSSSPSTTLPIPPIPSPLQSSTKTKNSSSTTTTTTKGPKFLYFLAWLSRLIPLQRSLLLLNLQKAHYYYQGQVDERIERIRRFREEGEEKGKEKEKEKGKGKEREDEREGDDDENGRPEKGVTDEGEELEEVVALFKECGLWNAVQSESDRVKHEREEKRPENGFKEEFEVVQLHGLPYLLHTPSTHFALRPAPPSHLFTSLARSESILYILQTMLQLVVTFQPSSPAIAHGRALIGRNTVSATTSTTASSLESIAGEAVLGVPSTNSNPTPPTTTTPRTARVRRGGAVAGGEEPPIVGGGGGQQLPPNPNPNNAAANRPRPPFPAVPPLRLVAHRRATFSITFHLNSIIRFLLPLLFLSCKLLFLLFIFGRHASDRKRIVLGVLTVVWVVWEGFKLRRRRRGYLVRVAMRLDGY